MFKKSLSIVLALIMALCTLSLTAFAANDVTVSLRIEGLNDCFFYDDVTVVDGSTVFDVLKAAAKSDNTLSITATESSYGAYITTINGVTAGNYTLVGWDGWMYRVNDVMPEVGVGSYIVKNNDEIVVFYGDPYNTGMQFPTIVLDQNTRTLTLSSMDKVYEGSASYISKCPVKDCKVTWGIAEGKTITLTTDENGCVVIPEEHFTYGEHSVQIEKATKTGLPTVLRVAPDFTIEVVDGRSTANKIIDTIRKLLNMFINLFKNLFKR